PNLHGYTAEAASPPFACQVPSRRPQPRSESRPPPRVYMQVSSPGQIRTPYIHASSPTLTIAVRSLSDWDAGNEPEYCPSPNRCCTPSRKRAPPTPPTRTVTFTLTDTRRWASQTVRRGGVTDTPR